MKLQAYTATDIGPTRETNEDRALVDAQLHFYAVADGMGGHQRGELAAEIALQSARDAFAARREGATTVEDLDQALRAAIETASKAVYERAREDPAVAGMGTTLTIAVVHDDTLIVGHVGDSRAYLVHEHRCRQLTNDHTLVADLVRSGALRPEKVAGHRLRHVLSRAVGSQPAVQVETLTIHLQAGDRVLLLTDGAFDGVASQQLATAAPGGPEAILELARDAGTRDNATVVLIEADAGSEDAEVARKPRELVLAAMARSVFRDLSFPQRAELLSEGDLIRVADHTVFIDDGEALDAAYLVVEGTGTVLVDGFEVSTLHLGDMVGVLSLVRERTSRGRLVGTSGLTLMRFSRGALGELIARRPTVGVRIYLTAAELASEAQERALDAMPTMGRLAEASPPWDFI